MKWITAPYLFWNCTQQRLRRMTTALWTCVLLLASFGDAVFGLPHIALFNFLSLVLWTLCLARAIQQENTKNSAVLTLNSWTFLDSKRENFNLKEFSHYLFIIYSLSEPHPPLLTAHFVVWPVLKWNLNKEEIFIAHHSPNSQCFVFFLKKKKKNFDWSNILSVRRSCPVGSKAKTLL